LAVDFQNWVYQSGWPEMPESYGMAWQATAIPEPSHLVFFGMGLLVWRLSRRSGALKGNWGAGKISFNFDGQKASQYGENIFSQTAEPDHGDFGRGGG
jgi:hypothetical protein